MFTKKLIKLLNNQIKLECVASMEYIAMGTWAEIKGYNGVATFFYKHAEEERGHMLKLVRFMNGRGVQAVIPNVSNVTSEFESLHVLFAHFLKSEEAVTKHINEIVGICLEEKDYTTHNFIQWYVSEQVEEENLARNIIDKLSMIGNDKGGLYLFDRDMEMFDAQGE